MAKNLKIVTPSATIRPANLRAFIVGSSAMDRVVINGTEYWRKRSDEMMLSCTVTQGNNTKNWADADYMINENFSTMTITDSSFGKSYGLFEVSLYRIRNGNQTQLAHKSGGYGGSAMSAEKIVSDNTQFSIRQGDIIRVRVGASYNPDVSGQHQTTSWIKFYLE